MTFNELYSSYADLVFNLSFSYLGNKQDAEEVTQDVFLKVHQHFSNFKGESHIKTWIFRICINHSLDFIKSRKRLKNRPQSHAINLEDVQVKLDLNPQDELEYKERYMQLMAAIGELSENRKTVLILSKIEGLSNSEIQQIMNLSKSNLESLLSRAKSELKKKLNL